MNIPTIDKYVDEATKHVDANGYIQEVAEILQKLGFKMAEEKAYAFAVLELWKKATKIDWIRPYADIVALKPYVAMVEQIKEETNKK